MKIKRLTPPQTITVSFAAVIAVGAALLALPAASANGRSVGMLNALFTSTSATCVTGLTVVVTAEHWSVFGKIVLLFLIQIGALGLLTFGALALIIFRHRISLKNQLVIQASFNQERVGGMSKLVSNVVKITLTFELCGTVLLFAAFAVSGMPLGEVLAQGLFHSVSAFCNAGFDNLGSDGLMPYRDNLFVCGVISLLTISGGLGFPVWAELFALRKPESRSSARLKIQHLTLHTKMTLTVTGILIVFGTLLVLLFEWSNPDTLARIHLPGKIHAAFFQSVTLRTAGFSTIHEGSLTDISKFFSCVFMIIGGSPAGSAGGIKTVTLGVVFASMLSALRGRSDTEAFGRALPLDLLQKALTVIMTMLIVVLAGSIILRITEPGVAFTDLLFEVCSAAGTVGVSAGLTPSLSVAGKLVITLCMFLGRLSPVTLVVALNLKMKANTDSIKRPNERVIIG